MALQKLNAQTLEGDLNVVDITASGDITLTSTGSFKVPSGTTAQRGTTATGALRFNTTDTSFEGYDGSAWGAIGGGSGENVYAKETFTATANQTIFTLTSAYTVGFIDVYLNGIKLVAGDDFTATSTSAPYTVVLSPGATLDDTLQTIAFNTFVVADTVPASGGTFSGTVTLSGAVNIAGAVLAVGTFTSRGIHDVAPSNALTIDANKNVGIGTASPASALTIAGATSNLSTFTEDLTVAANYSMAVIGPVTIPNVTVNGNLNIMTELNVTGDIDTGANGSFNIIG